MSSVAELIEEGVVEQRRAAGWWFVGLVAVSIVSLAFWPSLEGSDTLEAFRDMGEVMEAFGARDMATASGYLDGQLFALMLPVLLSAMAIAAVSALTAGAEDAGRLEVLVALPVRRRDVWLARGLAAALLVVGAGVALGALVLISRPLLSFGEVGPGRIVVACLGCTVLAMFHGAVAFAAAGSGARRPVVVGVAVGTLLVGYVLGLVVPIVDAIAWMRHLSPWTWSLGPQPVSDGVGLPWLGLTMSVSAVLVAAGVFGLGRRDVRAA